jgi:hypothetical protein
MVGTEQPSAGTNLSTLNPCPLNVCCNVWGQCGMNDDFCVFSKSESGAPGTSALKNGCKLALPKLKHSIKATALCWIMYIFVIMNVLLIVISSFLFILLTVPRYFEGEYS